MGWCVLTHSGNKQRTDVGCPRSWRRGKCDVLCNQRSKTWSRSLQLIMITDRRNVTFWASDTGSCVSCATKPEMAPACTAVLAARIWVRKLVFTWHVSEEVWIMNVMLHLIRNFAQGWLPLTKQFIYFTSMDVCPENCLGSVTSRNKCAMVCLIKVTENIRPLFIFFGPATLSSSEVYLLAFVLLDRKEKCRQNYRFGWCPWLLMQILDGEIQCHSHCEGGETKQAWADVAVKPFQMPIMVLMSAHANWWISDLLCFGWSWRERGNLLILIADVHDTCW